MNIHTAKEVGLVMRQQTFKVGDRVVHLPLPGIYNAPFFYKRMGCSEDDKLIVTAISVNDNVEINNNHVGFWSCERFKLYAEPNLTDKLAEAKAEVARIEQLILESQTPKVGSQYFNPTKTELVTVLEVYKNRIIGRREPTASLAQGDGLVQSTSCEIKDFKTLWPNLAEFGL